MGENNPPKLPFPVKCKYLVHTDSCFGYRFKIDNKTIAYCADTGVCDNLLQLSKNADVLIAECSYKQSQRDNGWPHLNPEDSAKIAKKADVGKLLLTHFDASIYRTKEDRAEAEKTAGKIFPRTNVCYDGFEIEI